MNKNPHVNWLGMVAFVGSIAVSVLFFIYTLIFHPGPVDAQPVAAPGLTVEQYVERKEAWIKSSPEAIARGQEVYRINCAFYYDENGKDKFLEMFKTGELPNSGTELEVFRMISQGNKELGILKLDHIREDERWDLVHYLRSLNTNLPTTPRSQWKQFFKQGA